MKKIILTVLLSAVVLALPATVIAGPLKLSWKDNSLSEEGFEIQRRLDEAGATYAELTKIGPNVVTFQDIPSTDQKYCYRVRAFNATGPSEWSNEACGLPKPNAPTTLELTFQGEITLKGTITLGQAPATR